MKKYIAYFGYKASITEVECDRETESSVWINGRRRSKNGRHETIHDSFDLAKESLLAAADMELTLARRALERAHGKLGNIKGMKP